MLRAFAKIIVKLLLAKAGIILRPGDQLERDPNHEGPIHHVVFGTVLYIRMMRWCLEPYKEASFITSCPTELAESVGQCHFLLDLFHQHSRVDSTGNVRALKDVIAILSSNLVCASNTGILCRISETPSSGYGL